MESYLDLHAFSLIAVLPVC